MTTAILNVPDELKQYRQWVLWRYEIVEGRNTKVPYQTNGNKVDVTNPKTWTSLNAVSTCCGNYNGIGFVVTDKDDLCGVDLDHCRNPLTGEINQPELDIINLLDSYTEITPSMEGVRVWLRGKKPSGGNRKKHIEIYDANRYFTVTGKHLEGTPTTIEERQDQLNQLHATIFPPEQKENKGNDHKPTIDLADTELLQKAMAARNGASFTKLWNGDTSEYDGDDSRADLALCSMLAFWTGNNEIRIDNLFRQSKLYRDKWERQDYRERTINKAIEGNHATYEPSNKTENKQAPPVTGTATLNEVLDKFRKHYELPNTGHIEIMLATIAANYGPGDPVWLAVVAPPSYGKTEPMNGMKGLPNIQEVSTLTEASLLSGTPKKDKASGANGGVLAKMGEFGILLIKDFSGMLTLNKETRGSIMAALREVYDGSWTRQVGADGGRELHWQGKCGLLAAATPNIDQHYAVMANLGERFCFYRIEEGDETKRAMRALANTGHEIEIRQELNTVVLQLFNGLSLKDAFHPLPSYEMSKMVALAHFATRCRSVVERDSYSNREIQLIPGAESATRLVKVLAMLFRGLLIIGTNRERAWELITKVALDSMPALRRNVLTMMLDNQDTLDWKTKELAEDLGYPTNTTRRVLEDLNCYDIVLRMEDGNADVWRLSDWTKDTYQLAKIVPEILEGVI
jgi:hypothetical protein